MTPEVQRLLGASGIGFLNGYVKDILPQGFDLLFTGGLGALSYLGAQNVRGQYSDVWTGALDGTASILGMSAARMARTVFSAGRTSAPARVQFSQPATQLRPMLNAQRVEI